MGRRMQDEDYLIDLIEEYAPGGETVLYKHVVNFAGTSGNTDGVLIYVTKSQDDITSSNFGDYDCNLVNALVEYQGTNISCYSVTGTSDAISFTTYTGTTISESGWSYFTDTVTEMTN